MNHRGLLFLVVWLAVIVTMIAAQQNQKDVSIVGNSDKPLNSKAGWTLKLEEVFRITDESGDFYFKRPGNIQVGPKGNIYLTDEEQFLKFSPEGKFIKNIYKKGQGPGEISSYFNYALVQNRIYVYVSQPSKLISFGIEGEFIEEKRFQENFAAFFGCLEEKFILLRSIWPPREERKGEFFLINNSICHLGMDGTHLFTGQNIPTKAVIIPGGGARFYPPATVRSTDGLHLNFNGSTDYVVDVIELGKGEIFQRFSREYQSVKYPEPKKKPTRLSSGMRPKYMRDIEAMFARKDSLWIATSMNDPEKGDMFDVFDMEGKYTDSFYIKSGGRVATVLEASLFMIERDEDGFYSIVKYRFQKE